MHSCATVAVQVSFSETDKYKEAWKVLSQGPSPYRLHPNSIKHTLWNKKRIFLYTRWRLGNSENGNKL